METQPKVVVPIAVALYQDAPNFPATVEVFSNYLPLC
jgi:hypothetical protein